MKITDEIINTNLKLIQFNTNQIVEQHEICFEANMSLSGYFTDKYKFEKDNLPYHINVIDELHANENAHSRILVKFLKYKEDKRYPILDSFIEYLNKIPQFEFKHKIVNPQITQEKYRIDALIVDEDYVIIIENKIHYAVDQDNQIENYIETVNEFSKIKKIYIIYLTGDGGQPADYSLSINKKEELISQNRYVEISYSSDIIDWLKDEVSIICNNNNQVYLNSSLDQYIDHLNGMFNLRKDQRIMETKILQNLSDYLNLGDNLDDNIKLLKEKVKETITTQKYLEKLILQQRVDNWINKLSDKYKSNIEPFKTEYSGKIHYGVRMKTDNNGLFSVLVETSLDGKTCLCLSSLHVNDDTEYDNVFKFIKSVLIERNKWYLQEEKSFYAYTFASSKERGFQLLNNQIDKILSQINNE